ncbi:MAG: Co2+/Mg2+ efflux protein ApaG [Saprospiraceae bacterium]|nr:MAG: Co2+/Mg2+ efflux protein ApaG [Saprospiraceae bacterium]
MQTLITEGIKISVEPFYLPNESLPAKQKYVHAYRVTIENQSRHTVQLMRRNWHIVESSGLKREVEGEGVIGEQPVLAPGKSYQYTSWCPLMTDLGKMYGTYTMQRLPDGETFKVRVPEFQLVPPFKMN